MSAGRPEAVLTEFCLAAKRPLLEVRVWDQMVRR